MDASKILMILCCFVLTVCLTLCISTLVVLRNAIAENGTVQNDAKELVSELDGCVAELNETITKNDSISASVNTDQNDGITGGFLIRESNGMVGVYSVDGTLLRLLDISVNSLPAADREALAKGIKVNSWRELIALMQDYAA